MVATPGRVFFYSLRGFTFQAGNVRTAFFKESLSGRHADADVLLALVVQGTIVVDEFLFVGREGG